MEAGVDDHPDGFSDHFSERDAAQLAEINRDRRAAVAPLEHLAERTEDADGVGMAEAAYRFLVEIQAADHLRNFSARLSQAGDPALAERELRIWDLLMEILDQTALVIGKNHIARARYAELLRLVIQTSSIASIPQGLDEVTVGAANRIRVAEPKVVFLVGTAQGVFPMTPGTGESSATGKGGNSSASACRSTIRRKGLRCRSAFSHIRRSAPLPRGST